MISIFCFTIDLIFDLMLFYGIFQIYQHVFVFGFVYFYQLAQLFIIVFIFGHINVFHLFRLDHQKNQLVSVRQQLTCLIWGHDFIILVIFDWMWFTAYCFYIGLFLFFPVHYILAENYPIVTRIIILIEQVEIFCWNSIKFYCYSRFDF